MKLNRKYWNTTIRDYMLGWTLAFIFLSIVRGIGTEELGALKFDLKASFLISFTLGPIIGIISGIAELLMEDSIYKRVPISKFLLIRLGYALIFLVFLVLAAYSVYQFYFGTQQSIIEFAFDTGSFVIYFYVLFVDFVLNTLRQVNLMLGYGNLSKLLQGKFYNPREEERIFMFLDLQSSTQLAEKLGNVTYSSLIQDCFNDLSVVVEYEAEIYQYVGDEAVLTWHLQKGLNKMNCLNAFYAFKAQIEKRAAHYQKKYGTQPYFKAGMHYGRVTVTEIGKYKVEIAYHGDAVNTSARIQGQCNALGAELLISKDLQDVLSQQKTSLPVAFASKGDTELKGKQNSMELIAVEQEALLS